MSFILRPATLADLPALNAVERAAAAIFRDSPYPFMADAPPADAADLRPAIVEGRILVAAHDADVAAFIWLERHDPDAYVAELDVHPSAQRQGLGAKLVDAAATWAFAHGLASLTLTTFRRIPWNAPYYERLGFEPFRDAMPAHLRSHLDAEAARGFPDRVAMRRRLTAAAPT